VPQAEIGDQGTQQHTARRWLWRASSYLAWAGAATTAGRELAVAKAKRAAWVTAVVDIVVLLVVCLDACRSKEFRDANRPHAR
jgi:hypothetical protein